MEKYEFFTLEVKSASSVDFEPCRLNDEIEKFDSFESAVSRCRYYCVYKSDVIIRVVRHIHASCIECEISKLNESPKFESYGKED